MLHEEEEEGKREGGCVILFLWFEVEGEVCVVAMGMDIKTTYPCYSKGKKEM